MANLPTPAEVDWMKEHINDTRVPDIIVSCSICGVASIIILGLRIWSRLQAIGKLVLSDYLVICSVAFYIGFCLVFALSTLYGEGTQIILIAKEPATVRLLAICNIISTILYGVATAFVKGSILALYLAIFPQQRFHHWVYFLTFVNWGNLVAIVLVCCLQCRPLPALWDATISGVCIDFSYFSVFNSAFNFVLDAMILLSPLPLIMRLNLSTNKRVLLAANFTLGGGACVIAAIRIPYARKVGGTANPSWDMPPGGMLCVAEVVVAILCASLPVYRPLLRRFIDSVASTSDPKYRGNSRGTNEYLGSGVNARIAGGGKQASARAGISITDDISMMTHTYVNGHWERVADDDETGLVLPMKGSLYSTSTKSYEP